MEAAPLAAQARELGISEADIAKMTKQAVKAPRRIKVFEENWPALKLFVAMATQWRRAGMSGLPAGLDYAALPVVAGALGLVLDAMLLTRLRTMEDAYVSAVLAKA